LKDNVAFAAIGLSYGHPLTGPRADGEAIAVAAGEAAGARGEMLVREILARMRHDGCGGRVAKAELLTGFEGVSSCAVRRIVLLGE
jgi:hypothetical protein